MKSNAPNPLRMKPVLKPRGESWWAELAAPDTPFDKFADAARARNLDMRTDPQWQRPEKLAQIGTL